MNPDARKTFVGIIGALSSIAGYGAFWQTRRYFESKQRWNTITERLDKWKPYPIFGLEAKIYPWMKGYKALEDWEYQVVKLDGFFGYERIFVRKTKNGRVGYCVFAPFVTALSDPEGYVGESNPAV